MRTTIIVNRAAGRGSVGKRWPLVEAALRAEGLEFESAFTERRGHATGLACQAVEAGFDQIVAVGGDGTLNEVVNGMVQDGKAVHPDLVLGVIAGGTGADFVRSAGLPREMTAAARHLAHATETRVVDLGEVVFQEGGQEVRRYFVNVAGMGLDGEVVERLERAGKRSGGTLPYLSSLAVTVARYRSKDVLLEFDGGSQVGALNSVIVCNGQYFGGGMRVAPNALLGDARFDVIVLGDFGLLEFLANVLRVYKGTHLSHPKVSSYLAQNVTVTPKQRMLIQVDGELIGAGAATFRIHPSALKLRV